MRNQNGLKRGFTLIELLVVIAIIAIIAALLFPVFARAKANAKQAACVANLSQAGKAIALYMADYDDLFPAMVDATDKYIPSIWNAHSDWQARIDSLPLVQDALAPYVKAPEVFKCPTDAGVDVVDQNFPLQLNAEPTLYTKYGCSYLLRTEIVFKSLSGTAYQAPAEVNVLFDASGYFHGQGRTLHPSDDGGTVVDLLRGYRYNVLYGDYHVKNRSYGQLQDAWATAL